MSELRKLREEAGLSREELSRLSSVSYNSIMGYEQGRFGMKLEPAKRLSDALAKLLPRSSSSLLTELATEAIQESEQQEKALA